MSDALSKSELYPQLHRLIEIMARLRDPQEGCPWDLKQTFDSLIPYTIEECYEVAEAIESGDMQDIKGELGDLLFQIVFYAQLGKENGSFDFEQVAKAISDKMIHRHPHVFSDHQYASQEEFEKDWQQRKEKENQDKSQQNKTDQNKGKILAKSLMADISQSLPAMTRAVKIQKRAAHIGFDWSESRQVLEKIKEEVAELDLAMQGDQQNAQTIEQVEEELGDLLFSCVNLSRKLKLDPETVLRKNNKKFMRRFEKLEQAFLYDRDKMTEASLDELEVVWQEIKKSL